VTRYLNMIPSRKIVELHVGAVKSYERWLAIHKRAPGGNAAAEAKALSEAAFVRDCKEMLEKRGHSYMLLGMYPKQGTTNTNREGTQ